MKRSTAQNFALVFGAVYLLIGILGFPITGLDDFAGKSYNQELLIFPINPLHNIVHIAIGLLWLASFSSEVRAKQANILIGGVLGLVTVLGALGVLHFLAIESFGSPDNFLHLITAALALYFGTTSAEADEVQAGEY